MKSVGILGAGATGRLVADLLVKRGHHVTLVSRSGRFPRGGYESAVADVRDSAQLSRVLSGSAQGAGGCDIVVNAVNPASYTAWQRDWPPMAEGIAEACRQLGAGLVTVGNLYAYGRVNTPMTEDQPVAANGAKGTVRAAMWEQALEQHRSGATPAVEVRASDYFGATAGPGVSLLMDYVLRPVAQGKTAWVPVGSLDAAHSWTYLPDIARLVADLVDSDQAGRRWGRVWHVPTAEARSMREVSDDVARLAEREPARIRRVPSPIMAAARVHPLVRALDETRHQFELPWIVDSTAAQSEFGWGPTNWQCALRETLAD